MREGVYGALHRSHRGAAPAHRSAGPLCERDRLEVWMFGCLAQNLRHLIDLGPMSRSTAANWRPSPR